MSRHHCPSRREHRSRPCQQQRCDGLLRDHLQVLGLVLVEQVKEHRGRGNKSRLTAVLFWFAHIRIYYDRLILEQQWRSNRANSRQVGESLGIAACTPGLAWSKRCWVILAVEQRGQRLVRITKGWEWRGQRVEHVPRLSVRVTSRRCATLALM